MPRKSTKAAKPPLLFLEPPLRGAGLQDVSEVRAAVNPKEYFTEERERNLAHNSWVIPQFNCSNAAPPVRRGRKKCNSSTNLFQSDIQQPKKNSVCKFPSLTFQTRARDEPHQRKSTNKQKVTDCTAVSGAGNQPQAPCQTKRTVSSTQYRDTPERQRTSIRKRNMRCSESAASSSRYLDQPETQSSQVPADRTSIHVCSDFSTTEVSGVGPPPDVHTPKVLQDGSCYSSVSSQHVLSPQSSTPPFNHPPDILVTDTPERDYGVKVTWRRRRELMLLLIERGLLSDSEILVHTQF